MLPADRRFEDIAVGERVSFERTFSMEDVRTFAALSGDWNPLHLDEAYAASTRFKRPLVHGMLLGALCSALVGMYLPGKRCVYVRQTLSFRKPVPVGDAVLVAGVVTEKIESTRMLTIAISITHGSDIVTEGAATVLVLS